MKGNQIHWTFYGKDQKTTGRYSLILVGNENEKGMITTDTCDFVNVVSCSCKVKNSEDSTNVETETIELTSNLDYVAGTGGGGEGGGSYDDTAIWEALNDKVDKEEGKGLSEENFTTDEKQKLAGLENYDDSGIKTDIEDLSKKVEDLEQGGQGGSTPDLSEYLTKEEFYEASERYATTDSLEDYLTKEEFSETIERYATTDALEGFATTQQLTELSTEVSGLSEGIALRNVGAEDTDESVDEPEIPTPAPSGNKEWKCVFDGRLAEGTKSWDFSKFADGTPLQATELIIQILCDKTSSANVTGYVQINSTTNN